MHSDIIEFNLFQAEYELHTPWRATISTVLIKNKLITVT